MMWHWWTLTFNDNNLFDHLFFPLRLGTVTVITINNLNWLWSLVLLVQNTCFQRSDNTCMLHLIVLFLSCFLFDFGNLFQSSLDKHHLFCFGSFFGVFLGCNLSWASSSNWILILLVSRISVQGSGCMDRKKTENWTEPDRLGLDQRLQLPAFQNKKTAKKPVVTDRLQSVAIGFRYSSKIRTFWAYFEENRARNACATAKMICYGEIRLCMTSCSCIFEF